MKKMMAIEKEKKDLRAFSYQKIVKNDLKIGTYKGLKKEIVLISYSKKILETKPLILEKNLIRIFKDLLKPIVGNDKIMIIGLGNHEIVADSIGVVCTNKLKATMNYNFISLPKVMLFNPDVMANTGVGSYDLIKLVIKEFQPKQIIVIDAMETKLRENLYYSMELNNFGMIDKEEINDNKIINENTFDIPIVFVGVPLIYNDKELFTSPYIKEIVNQTSNVISKALNKLLT